MPNSCSACCSRRKIEVSIGFISLGIFIASTVIFFMAEEGSVDPDWKELSIFLILMSLISAGCFFVFACFDRTLPIYEEEDEPSFCGCGRIWAFLKKCFCCRCKQTPDDEPEIRHNEPPTDTTEELPSTDITESCTTDTTIQSPQPKEEMELATFSQKEQEPSVSTVLTDAKSTDNQETKL